MSLEDNCPEGSLLFERDMRRFLTIGLRLSREGLVIMMELLANLDCCAGALDNYEVTIRSRALSSATGIERQNLSSAMKKLVQLGIIARGEAATYDLRVFFSRFEEWLDAGTPAAEPKRKAAKKAGSKAA